MFVYYQQSVFPKLTCIVSAIISSLLYVVSCCNNLFLTFQSLQNDTNMCKAALDEIEKLKSELDPLCQKDVPDVEERIEKLKEHVDEVEKLGNHRQNDISDIQEKVEQFNAIARPTKDKLTKLEKDFAKQNLLGADKPKTMEVSKELKKLQKQVDDLEPKVEQLNKIGEDMQEQHSTTDSKHLRDEASETKDRLDKLKANVKDKTDEVDDIAKEWDNLESDVAKALEAVKKANDSLQNNKLKKLDVDELPCQMENIKCVESELDENKPLFDDIQKRGRKLREKGIGAEIGDQLAGINNQLNDIKKEIPERTDELGTVKDNLDDLKKKLEEADKDMGDLEKKIEEQSPVGGDKDTIDAQMEELKHLNDDLEKVQAKLAELNDIRSDLKSKYPNADSSKVDEPIDALNDRLAQLNQKISGRQGKLEGAMVQCGQFDDAIKSMLSWLQDTDELVRNQKPIAAADQNVLKAQIQEQKLFNRMFDDREPSIANLNKTGEELLTTTEDEDKKKEIKEALDNVNKMWDNLKGKTDDRQKALEDTLAASEKFNKAFDNIKEKINEQKKKVDSDDNVPSTDPVKVDEQLDAVKGINEDNKAIEPLLEELKKDLEEIEPFCTPEDAALLHSKCDDLVGQFGQLNDTRDDKEHTLNDAHDLLNDFFKKDKELDDWINEAKKDIADLTNAPDAEKIKNLQKDIAAHKDDVEKLKETAKDLKKLVKPEEYPNIKKVVEAAEEKYKSLKVDIDETARNVFMNEEKVQAFDNKLDKLKKWTDNKLENYRVIEPIAVEADKIKEQLNEHTPLQAEVSGKEPQFAEVYEMGNTILAGCNEEEEPAIRSRIDNLKFNKQKVNKLTLERHEALVEALLLAQQFADVYKDVGSRLTNTEELLEAVDEQKGRGVEMQKEKLQNIEDNIKQLQPLMTAIQRTGADLIKLSGPGQGADSVQKKIDECVERWNNLKQSSEEKGIKVGAAAEQVESIWNDLEELIEKTQTIKNDIKKQEPVPIQEEPILEEIKALEQQEADLSAMEEPYTRVNERIENVLQIDPTSPASKALKDKQRKLGNLWKFITVATPERRKALEDTKKAAEKFWSGLDKIRDTLVEVQDKLDDEAEPGVDPDSIDLLMKEHKTLRAELASNEDVIGTLSEVTPKLVEHASQENKIEVYKNLSEVTEQWEALEKAWKQRRDELEHTKAMAVDFAEEKARLEEFLTASENEVNSFAAVPSDMNELRAQLRKLRVFHRDMTKHQNEITRLDQNGNLLAEKVHDEDSQVVREQLDEIERRWEKLLDTSYDHQHQLEDALLESGHFGVAIEELLIWIDQTKTSLTSEEELPKEKKLIEVELSKLKVVANDVESHRPSVESCSSKAQNLIDEDKAADKPGLQSKLQELNIGWEELQKLLKAREGKLNNAFEESKRFQDEVRELIVWLSEARVFLRSKAPYGGKVESTTKQLDKHKEFIRIIEIREERYIYIVEIFEVLIKTSDMINARVLDKALTEIRTTWSEVITLSKNKLEKLEDALENARTLETYITEMEVWLVRVEGSLGLFAPVSTILETITVQITEFNEIYTEVSAKREVFKQIRSTANIITEHCFMEEVKTIEYEITELTVRWKPIVGKLKDRKKELDENYDQSLIFFEGHEQLMSFLDEIEGKINSDPTIGKDAHSVKAQLRKHREFQVELGKKQSKLNATIKAGQGLIPKSQPEEVTIIEVRINDLRARWDVVCVISVDRQHQLEEALLFHGMFHDAVQALLDWIKHAEPSLASETAVMGDTDTVKLLMDNHKAFQRELQKRQKNYESIVSTGETMLKEGKVDNAEALNEQLNTLKDRWQVIFQLSGTKQERLQNAYTLSKEFQSGTRDVLSALANLENQLKAQGPIAEDVSGIQKQQEEFAAFEELLNSEEVRVNGCLKKGEVILRFCHPSSLHTIRHQVAVIKKRWNDVAGWARQRKARLDAEILEISEEEGLILILIEWITEQETVLEDREGRPLPVDYDLLTQLLDEHKLTQADAEQKQPDFGKVMKRAKRKPLTDRQRRAISEKKGKQPPQRDFTNPLVDQLSKRWQHLWLILMDRYRRLNEHLDNMRIQKAASEFSWDNWRNKYNSWLHESKSRVLDMWRKHDNDKDNKLSRDQFLNGLLDSAFPCERWELELVFDKIKRGELITYQDYMDALKGRKRKPDRPLTESEQIHDIIGKEVSKCCCAQKYQMSKVSEGKYRLGDNQQLRLVRILRSTVMVRVGGGWESLQDFLQKHDPCRGEFSYQLLLFYTVLNFPTLVFTSSLNVKYDEWFRIAI